MKKTEMGLNINIKAFKILLHCGLMLTGYNKFHGKIKWNLFKILKIYNLVFSGTIIMTPLFYTVEQQLYFIAELPEINWFFFLITMCNSFPPTGHDSITQLNDLRNSDYLFGMIPLVRQQHQKKKDIRNNCFRLPENKKTKMSSLNCTTLFSRNEPVSTKFFLKNAFCFYITFQWFVPDSLLPFFQRI